ncbi:hypothetical protein CBS14141_000524 [Malassezia furfur]|nr:hypothetical protein CBS14141_000524 [Malassezia furfur]
MSTTAFQPPMPECWGHRGASAAFPENTLASFEQAIRDGSEGIENVHVTADDTLVMFHDTTLDRTTNSKGALARRPYYGPEGIEHVRTIEKPVQQIPTFDQLCELLMKEENRHVKLNVDIKPDNDPERLFTLMDKIVRKFHNYEKDLAPRLILGLWHPKFLEPAKKHVPTLFRAHIGASPADALKYFWDDCGAFSLCFPALVTGEGQNFLKRAKEENKDVMVWTVNRIDEMIEATRWGVKAIITDRTDVLHKLREEMAQDFIATERKYVSPWFRWANYRYYTPTAWMYGQMCSHNVEERAGITYAQSAQQARAAAAS